MKNLQKYLVLAGVVAVSSMAVQAEVSVKETTSPEFLYNQGYSKEASRIIENKTKDPMTPIPEKETSKMKKFGLYLIRTIDPSLDNGEFAQHDIKYNPTLEDL